MSYRYSTIYVKTGQYEFSHGKSPRGEGRWAFQIGGRVEWFNGGYGAAKREAQKIAAQREFIEIEVLP